MKYPTYEPRRATKGSAGYDIYAPHDYDLEPGVWTMIDTGVAFTDEDCAEDFGRWFMMVVPRSGLSTKYGFRLRNTVAIIDMDYRDTIKLSVSVDTPYHVVAGERVAQGIILPFGVFHRETKPMDVRTGGFGSTGQ